MYLLDNKLKISENLIKSIDNINSKTELLNRISDNFNGFDYFFDKIEYSLMAANLKKTKTTNENIINLFCSSPLNLDKNDPKIKEILENFSNDYRKLEIVKEYKKLLKSKIISNENNLSSYEIVGHITRNFNNLFYGQGFIVKEDMDLLLYEVEQINKIKTKSQNIEDVNNKLDLLLEKINIEKSDNIEVDLDNALEKIKNLDQDNLKKIEEFKNLVYARNKTLQNLFFQNTKFLNEDNKIFVKFLIENKIIPHEHSFYVFEKTPYSNKIEILSKLIETKPNGLNLDEIINSFDFIKIKATKIEKEYNSLIDEFIQNNNLNINPNEDFKIKKIKNVLYSYKNSILNEYKEIKRDYVSILDKQDKTLFINKQYTLKAYEYNKEKNELTTLISELVKDKDLKNYSINEIKQLFYLVTNNNKNIYNIYTNTNIFNNLKDNKLINEILEQKDNSLENFDKQRLKYILPIIINRKNIDQLFTTDININIKEMFYDKLGLTIDDEISKYKLNELYKIFQEKQESLNYKNSNILLGIVLEAYEDKKFNNEKFEKLFNIVKTPINKLTNDDKNLVNQIEDKWIKWSICFNREIKDKSLIYSGINPLTFDYSKMQTMKKIFKDIYGENKEIKKREYNIINFLLNDKKEDNDFNDTINKFKEIYGNKISNIKKDKQNNFKKMFSYYLQDLVEYQNHKVIGKEIKSIKEALMNSQGKTKSDINTIFMNLFNLSKSIKICKTINDDSKFKTIFNLIKEKRNNTKLLEVIKYTKDNNMLDYFLEVLSIIPKIDMNNFKGYMNYYNTMSQSPTFKNYREETSLIPIISKDIGEGYSYKVKTIKDFDILLTGEKTKCCMTLNGGAFNIYKYMYENPKENVIFEVYKNGTPVANSWTWIKDNRVCFDNIEILGNELRKNIIKAYQDISLEFIVNHGIEETTFGVAHSDININMLGNDIKTNIPNKHLNCYTDSKIQKGILSLNDNIKHIDEALIKIISIKNNENLVNTFIEKYEDKYKGVNLKEVIKMNKSTNKPKKNLKSIEEGLSKIEETLELNF